MFIRSLRLMFNDTGASGSSSTENPDPNAGNPPAEQQQPGTPGTPATGTPSNEPQLNAHGYPDNTPIASMTAEHQAAYWKFHSRKHEADLEIERKKNLSDEEKEADRLRAEGAASAGATHLADAVEGHLTALTGKTEAEITAALEFVDVSRFAGANGRLDKTKVKAFADTLGKTSEPTPPGDFQQRYTQGLQRTAAPGQRTAGTIASIKADALERMRPAAGK